MLSRVLLVVFGLLQLLSSHLGEAIPLGHKLVKRADINCQPIDPTSELDFADCFSTIQQMVDGKTRAEQNLLQWFGSTPAANVQFQTLQWAFSTS